MAKADIDVADVTTPCLLLDIDKVKQNANSMIERCRKLGVKFRPHMKTHKCLQIGELSTGGTRACIAVATLTEAEFFARGGFEDILCTALFTADKVDRMKTLSQELKLFHVMVDSSYAISLLNVPPATDRCWSAYLKVDCGNNRGGVRWDDTAEALSLAKAMSDSSGSIRFQGLYCHDGDSYTCRGASEIKTAGEKSTERLLQLADKLRTGGICVPIVGLGSTPTSSHPTEAMRKLTELHPGNYIFYDVAQSVIGSCNIDEIAVKVATRVIGHYPHRNQLLVDAGFAAMSHDGKGVLPNRSTCVVQDHPELSLVNMNQEVGFIEAVNGTMNYAELPLGSILFLLPYHSCATAMMHSHYLVCSGDKVIDAWNKCSGPW